MDTLEQTDRASAQPPMPYSADPMGAPPGTTRRRIQMAIGILLLAGLAYWSFVEPKIFTTVVTIIVATGLTAALWIAANLLFDQVRYRWVRFNVLAFGALGALYGVMLHGNQITIGSGRGFLTWVLGPVVAAAAFALLAGALALTDDPVRRRSLALGGSIAIGVATGLLIRPRYQPDLDLAATAIYTAVGIVVGAGLSWIRKRPVIGGILTGAAIGWVVGAWGGADLGAGSVLDRSDRLRRSRGAHRVAPRPHVERGVRGTGAHRRPLAGRHLRRAGTRVRAGDARHPGDPHVLPVALRP